MLAKRRDAVTSGSQSAYPYHAGHLALCSPPSEGAAAGAHARTAEALAADGMEQLALLLRQIDETSSGRIAGLREDQQRGI